MTENESLVPAEWYEIAAEAEPLIARIQRRAAPSHAGGEA